MATDEQPDRRRARFEALARRDLIEPLHRFLRRRTDPETAADALSETLLVCWRRFDEVPQEQPLPWAYGVARNCLANAERAARRQRRVAARIAVLDPPREVSPSGSGDGVLHDALARLSVDEADLLRLWAWEQLAPGEIATVLGVTANAVSIRLHRARGRLREEIGKIEAVAGHEQADEGNDR